MHKIWEKKKVIILIKEQVKGCNFLLYVPAPKSQPPLPAALQYMDDKIQHLERGKIQRRKLSKTKSIWSVKWVTNGQMASRTATKSEIVAKLNLKPHPEGGFYSETFRDSSIILSKSHLPPQCKPSPSLVFTRNVNFSESWCCLKFYILFLLSQILYSFFDINL